MLLFASLIIIPAQELNGKLQDNSYLSINGSIDLALVAHSWISPEQCVEWVCACSSHVETTDSNAPSRNSRMTKFRAENSPVHLKSGAWLRTAPWCWNRSERHLSKTRGGGGEDSSVETLAFKSHCHARTQLHHQRGHLKRSLLCHIV